MNQNQYNPQAVNILLYNESQCVVRLITNRICHEILIQKRKNVYPSILVGLMMMCLNTLSGRRELYDNNSHRKKKSSIPPVGGILLSLTYSNSLDNVMILTTKTTLIRYVTSARKDWNNATAKVAILL